MFRYFQYLIAVFILIAIFHLTITIICLHSYIVLDIPTKY